MKIWALALTIFLAGAALCTVNAQWPLGRELNDAKPAESVGQHLTGGGRFQLFVTPQAKTSTFMVDTESGRLWIMKKDSSSGEYSLHRIVVEGVDTKHTGNETSGTTEQKPVESVGKP